MNIVSKTFTKEQYKALYEAQQLGVRFDCYLLAPGHSVWKADLPLVDERALQTYIHQRPLTCKDNDSDRFIG